MRVSEAVALDQEDVDLPNGILSIRRTKFGKSRLVPVHTSTRKALEQYAGERDRRFPKAKSTAFFVSERGTRVTACTIRDNFVKVSREVGLRVEDGRRYGRGPRLHDMRHRFAVLLNFKKLLDKCS